MNGALGGFAFVFIPALEIIVGYSPVVAGSALVPVTVVTVLLSGASGRLTQRIGPRPPLVAGCLLCAAASTLAVGTRLLRTQQTIDIAVGGREVPVLIEPGFDELRVGDLEGAPIEAYRSWRGQHAASDRLPHGESVQDALRRYAGALRRLLAREEPVTLVVVHELALRYITIAAATGSPPPPGTALKNAVPYLFDERAVRRATNTLDALTLPGAANG